MGPEKYREYASDIHESGVHLLTVINNILDIAKIESGARAIYKEDVDIEMLVGDCLCLMQERADSSGVARETCCESRIVGPIFTINGISGNARFNRILRFV